MNWKLILTYPRWDLILWGAWVLMFFALEGIGLARSKDATLTLILRNGVPRWLLAGLLGWLAYHFLIAK